MKLRHSFAIALAIVAFSFTAYAANPAPKGSQVIVFLTGDGIPSTLGIDGRPAAAPFQKPQAAVLVSVNGGLVNTPFTSKIWRNK